MAHYAFINDSNVVVEVIVGREEDDLPHGITSWEDYYGAIRGLKCLRTSYNTYRDYEIEFDDSIPPQVIEMTYLGSKHRENGTPFRGQYASIGDIYDAEIDEFVTPQSEQE